MWNLGLLGAASGASFEEPILDGLTLRLDAGNPNSYSGSGSSWYDLSGNNYTGTLSNTSFDSADGGSIVFNGSSSIANFAVNGFQVATEATIANFTIDLWVNWSAFPSPGVDELVSWWSPAGNIYPDGFFGARPDGGMRFGDGWGSVPVIFNTSTDTNKWFHLVAVKDGSSNAYVYKNGVLVASKGSNLSWGVNRNLALGAQHEAAEYFNGKMAILNLYTRALSLSEIQTNYNTFKTRFGL